MNPEDPVPFCERLGEKFPWSTHQQSDSEGGDKIKGHPTRRQVIWSQWSDPLLGRDEVTRTNRGAEGIGGRVKFFNRPYGYRGLKIFTSLKLRFQDFQRLRQNQCLAPEIH
jgi:hypothetical protein